MKNRIIIFLAVTIFFTTGCRFSSKNQNDSQEELNGTISISGAFALYPLAQKWAEEFHKLHPKVRIDVSAGGAGKGITDALSNLVNLGMVSREISNEEINKGAWFVAVTKDAVVPIINENNPVLQKLLNKGLTREELKDIFITGKLNNWGDAGTDKKVKNKINIYTRADACGAADVWAKYLGKKQENLMGTAVSGDPGITEAVKSDVNGIGYNNIAYAYDSKTKYELAGIKVLPIDFNGNGIIDDREFFYQHKDSLIKAIADGRYPSPPARDLYFVSKDKPSNKIVVAFLNWILTDGQKYVAEAGYINLPESKIKSSLDKIK